MARKAARVLNPCFNALLEPYWAEVPHYGVRLPFSPSGAQLLDYALARGHKPIYNTELTPPRPTFDDKALQKLRAKHPDDRVYPLVQRYREVERVRGTYIDGVRPDAGGYVHCTLGHLPKTLRLSAKAPNLQNLPRVDPDAESTDLYTRVREMYRASPGCVLLARDFSGIEAALVAYLGNDPALLRLCRLGVHDFFTAHVVGEPADLSWSDVDLRLYFADIKRRHKAIRTVCKTVVHSSNYAAKPWKLWIENPTVFESAKHAAYYQDIYLGLFPSIKTWWTAVCDEAEAKGFITAPDGFRMHYQGVYDYHFSKRDAVWVKSFGDTAKECIAAKPQHLGALYLATAQAVLFEDHFAEAGQYMILPVHDEILLDVPEEIADTVDRRVSEVMERAMGCMPLPPEWGMGSHLAIGTEGKRSGIEGSWASMH